MRAVVRAVLFLAAFILLVLIGAAIGGRLRDTQYARRTMNNEKVCIVILLPNQGQMQQILNAIEPNNPLKVDYVIGADSRAKWDRVVNNAYAIAHIKKAQEHKSTRHKAQGQISR